MNVDEGINIFYMGISTLFASMFLAFIMQVVYLNNDIQNSIAREAQAEEIMSTHAQYAAYDDQVIQGQDILNFIMSTRGQQFVVLCKGETPGVGGDKPAISYIGLPTAGNNYVLFADSDTDVPTYAGSNSYQKAGLLETYFFPPSGVEAPNVNRYLSDGTPVTGKWVDLFRVNGNSSTVGIPRTNCQINRYDTYNDRGADPDFYSKKLLYEKQDIIKKYRHDVFKTYSDKKHQDASTDGLFGTWKSHLYYYDKDGVNVAGIVYRRGADNPGNHGSQYSH